MEFFLTCEIFYYLLLIFRVDSIKVGCVSLMAIDFFPEGGLFWRQIFHRGYDQYAVGVSENWAGPQMPTTKNIERQMVSVGDPNS